MITEQLLLHRPCLVNAHLPVRVLLAACVQAKHRKVSAADPANEVLARSLFHARRSLQAQLELAETKQRLEAASPAGFTVPPITEEKNKPHRTALAFSPVSSDGTPGQNGLNVSMHRP